MIDALQRLAPISRSSRRKSPATAPPTLVPASSGRSTRRHQGVHPEALRLHRQYRPGRGWPAPLRPRLCARAVNARHHIRSRQGNRGDGRAERAWLGPRSARLPDIACARALPDGLVAVVSRSSRSGHGGLPRQAQDSWQVRRRICAEIPRGRPWRCRRLSALRPDHGVGHGGRPRDPHRRRRPCRGRRGKAAPLRQDRTAQSWLCRLGPKRHGMLTGQPLFSNCLSKS